MQPRVSSATVALAVTFLSTVLRDDVEARPMHADIVSKYHRYLEEKDTISEELNAWLDKHGPAGKGDGYIPVTESRSSDDALEDQRQRFYLTKEQIYEAREANPMAEFTTDGPFTLMTMDEFKQFLSNTHVSESGKTERPAVEKPKTLSEKQNDTHATDESKHNDSKNNDDNESRSKDTDTNKKTFAPATEGPTVIAAMRQLRSSGKSQYAFNGGDYSTNGEQGFQSTSENYIQTSQPNYQGQPSQQTYQSQSSPQTYQANTPNCNNGGNTNGGWNFGDVSKGDSAQVARVSGGTGSSNGYNTGNWWGTNGWGGNSWWASNTTWWGWGNGGSSAGSWNSQWTAPPESSNNQWTPSSNNQWTEPPSNNQQPTPQAPTTPAPTAAPVTNPPTPATKPPAPAPAPAPVPKPPAPASPVTKKPVTRAPAPVPATKLKAKATDSTTTDTTARDSDSDSVDWTKSACVNPPGLQGQCGSCWAFATIGALEAAHCIANGDKKAPSYSEQRLVSCDTKDYGCNGGAPVYAMEYVRDNGVCTRSSYPYTSVDGGNAAACTKSCTPTKSGIKEIVQLKSGDETALLSALKKQPVIVSVVSNNPAWKQYKSGVITSCNTATVDHAVLAVGYDATSIKIKNSWGTDWGEDGYVRISRSTQNLGTCAVLTDMSYPKV